MKTIDNLIRGYKNYIDSSSVNIPDYLVKVEFAIRFLEKFLPLKNIEALPLLLHGYPNVLGASASQDSRHALINLRHICHEYIYTLSWQEDLLKYWNFPEHKRLYQLKNTLNQNDNFFNFSQPFAIRTDGTQQYEISRSSLINQERVDFLDSFFERIAPWKEQFPKVVTSAEAELRFSGFSDNRTYLYRIPKGSEVFLTNKKTHAYQERTNNPPIFFSRDELSEIAGRASMAGTLSENLKKRFDNTEFDQNPDWKKGTIKIDQVSHIVGMLSSGKSTLVIVLLHALAERGKRSVVIVRDTVTAAKNAAYFRNHGINASVLSSFGQRGTHLNSIHWQQSLGRDGWNISNIGELVRGFGVACPMNGVQTELEQVWIPQKSDDSLKSSWPRFEDKPCNRFYPTDTDNPRQHSCPYFFHCPAREQNVNATDAQILFMTLPALVEMAPDQMVSRFNSTFFDIITHDYDVVFIDECDRVQKELDQKFAPEEDVFSEEFENFFHSTLRSVNDSVRKVSGGQWQKKKVRKYTSYLSQYTHALSQLLGLLQIHKEDLRKYCWNKPFTAASILIHFWGREEEKLYGRFSLEDENTKIKFKERLYLLIRLGMYEEQHSEVITLSHGIKKAWDALSKCRDKLRLGHDFTDIKKDILKHLKGDLDEFAYCYKVKHNPVSPEKNAVILLATLLSEMALSTYSWLNKSQPSVASDLELKEENFFGHQRLMRRYRSMIPVNPAGRTFGLIFQDAKLHEGQGGRLKIINHFAVGRYLLTHLHRIRKDEGIAGPHTVLLSGTSWSGGSLKVKADNEDFWVASPSYDVQIPVSVVLKQPPEEIKAVKQSIFSLVHIKDQRKRPNGICKQVRASGRKPGERRKALHYAAQQLLKLNTGLNQIIIDWNKCENEWGSQFLEDRKRAMFVLGSYEDAKEVGRRLGEDFASPEYQDWHIWVIEKDPDLKKQDHREDATGKWYNPIPRSMVEDFGQSPENSVLIAPIHVISRGHNILNQHGKAAISSVYFLYRPHPRPDDFSATIGEVNRFAISEYNKSNGKDTDPEKFMKKIRNKANRLTKEGFSSRLWGFSRMSDKYRMQFIWDMIPLIWQTIGRVIRGGVPCYVGFVDRQFAPNTFDEKGKDSLKTSVLIGLKEQLALAFDPEKNNESHIALQLYEPFYDALCRMKELS